MAAGRNKEVGVGNSMITKAGNQNGQVIHTVGPKESEFMKDPKLLAKAFTSALEAARGLKAQTVAIPLISGGKFVEMFQNILKRKEKAEILTKILMPKRLITLTPESIEEINDPER